MLLTYTLKNGCYGKFMLHKFYHNKKKKFFKQNIKLGRVIPKSIMLCLSDCLW